MSAEALRGALTHHTWSGSRVYPGVTHDYWVYVPPEVDNARPACAMVFQDGWQYVDPKGPVNAPAVMDDLIAAKDIPRTVGVFVNPAMRNEPWDERAAQYVPLDDTYARFLLDEMLPRVAEQVPLTDEASERAICGFSDGGLCAFTVAWRHPTAFSKVVCHCASFTRLPGGAEYPHLIRGTRGDPKLIRVLLQDGRNDINLGEGNWWLANVSMASALRFARYDYRFEGGDGGHDLQHAGRIFADTLRWLWRDHPDAKGCGQLSNPNAVLGRWAMQINALGQRRQGILTLSLDDGALKATLTDDVDGDIAVTQARYHDGVLTLDYVAPTTQQAWGKGSLTTMSAWLQVRGDEMEGALSSPGAQPQFDFSIKARRQPD